MKMRVLICIPCLLVGGTEVQTLNLVRALVDGGHMVAVACYFEHTEEMVEQYRRAGAQVELLSPDGNRYGGWKGIRHLWKGLSKTVKSFKPDVMHVQYMAPGAIPIVLLQLMGVRNIIATAHTMADIYTPKGLKLVRFIQRHCVKVFTCITERAEKSFFGTSTLYTPGVKLKKRNHFTIYNALPPSISIRQTARAFDPQNVTIGVVSRLEEIKGMDLIIPAFHAAFTKAGAGTDMNMLVVGEGSLGKMMTQQAEELGISDRIEFTGRVDSDNIQDCYDRIDILLMPSRSEGFGLTALEAMARGCVVIASDVGGLPELLDGGAGVTVALDSETSRALATATCALIDNPGSLAQISAGAQHRVADFTFARYSAAFQALYGQLQ